MAAPLGIIFNLFGLERVNMEINIQQFDHIARTVFAPAYPLIADHIIARTGVTRGVCLDIGCGGERQLVLIGRALAQGADIFVMDEPVNGLDYGNQIRLLARIAELSRSGFTFIKTTHFPDHALWVSDRVVMLKEGCVVADGPAAETINKANLYQLYNTHVDVVGLNGGGRICVPHALRRYSGVRQSSVKDRDNHLQRVRVTG